MPATDLKNEPLKMLSDFQRGVLYAAVHLQNAHNETGLAADLLITAGFSDLNCTELDDFDKATLCEVNKEKDMSLKGIHAELQDNDVFPFLD